MSATEEKALSPQLLPGECAPTNQSVSSSWSFVKSQLSDIVPTLLEAQGQITPYRAIVYTAQLDSYRELVRLLSDLQRIQETTLTNYDEPYATAPRHVDHPLTSRRERAACTTLAISRVQMTQLVQRLDVAVAIGNAIGPRHLLEMFYNSSRKLAPIKALLSLIENRRLLDMGLDGESCLSLSADFKLAIRRLVHSIDTLVSALRQSIQFDQLNLIPRE